MQFSLFGICKCMQSVEWIQLYVCMYIFMYVCVCMNVFMHTHMYVLMSEF